MQLEYEPLLTPKSIWLLKQNKPSYIVADLLYFGVPKEITYKVLLARGVFKWLSVRRLLISLKDIWKDRIKETLVNISKAKKQRDKEKLYFYRGYLKAMEECRKEVRALCHSERWQAPAFDQSAQLFLKELEDNLIK